LKTRIKQIMD